MTDVIVQLSAQFRDGMPGNVCIPERCFDLYRVTWRESYVTERGSVAGWLTAPDVESARNALRHAGIDDGIEAVLWPASVCVGPEPADANVLVEWSFDAPGACADDARSDAAGWWLEVHGVKFVRAYVSTDRCHALAIFQAADPESVRAAGRRAGIPMEDAWRFSRTDGPPLPMPAA